MGVGRVSTVRQALLVGLFLFVLSIGLIGVVVGVGIDTQIDSDVTPALTNDTDVSVNGTVFTASGDPAAGDGIVVFVEEGSSIGSTEMVVTDESGSFSVTTPPGDTFDVGFYRGYPASDPPFPADGVPDVYALARVDGSTDLGTVQLPAGHPVEVIVVDENGEPVEGATVSVEHRNEGATVALAGITTNANGRMDLPSGTSLDLAGDVRIQVKRPPSDNRFVDDPQSTSLVVTGPEEIVVELPSPTEPVAHVDAPPTVASGDGVLLDASGSVDPDDGWLDFEWKQVSGPPVSLDTANAAAATFTAPATDTPAELTFEVTVTDRYGLSDGTSVTVTVEPDTERIPDEDPMQLVATPDGNSVVVTVIHGEDGEFASATIPAWDGPIRPSEIGVRLGADVRIGSMMMTTTTEPPEQITAIGEAQSYVAFDGIGLDENEIDSLTVVFPVEGISSDVSVYQWTHGEWSELDAVIEDDTTIFELQTTSLLAFVVAPETPSPTPEVTSTPQQTTEEPLTESQTASPVAAASEPPDQTNTVVTPTATVTNTDASGFGLVLTLFGLLGGVALAFRYRRQR